LVILLGAGMLMLPRAQAVDLSIVDVFFTSASAVCVTGLSVVDTESSFTMMGKTIILVLIQLGGLGMMTFTGFFSFIFTSRATLQERMLIRDLFSAESLNNLFKLLIKIVLFTFLIEGTGALVIYFSLAANVPDRIFFSVFHSVSAFCNAGFSTLSAGMMSPGLAGNYTLLTMISLLIILGGLGFPVLLKLYAVIKRRILSAWDAITGRRIIMRIEKFDASSKIAFRATIFLIVAGLAFLYFLEDDRTLSGLPLREKLFLSYFNSVTARTAGFNMSDLSLLGFPSLIIMIGLMWIGASPGSTGGGIKTTTFSLAVRVAWNTVRGRRNLEISGREINPGTVSRVLSIIILSLIVIAAGFFCLLLTEEGKEPVSLLFETVSAYSTVGLSVAGTPGFSEPGKIILMLIMFIGRVGPLTLLTGLFISKRRKLFSYPSGDILIN
ncbi:MAG: hypothetical protein MUD02_09740, partial [Bacteroidales bacterium]|nr:hypothetical protein [Bacteroidales bacterium]